LKRLIALLLLLVAALVAAQDLKPLPRANITREQWEAYFRQVSERPSVTKREFSAEHLLVFEDRESYISWAFTTSQHPAHPALIARQAGERAIRQIGYFAGDEKPFAEMFRTFQALNEKIQEEVQKRSGETR
jgi:hypothetical protein